MLALLQILFFQNHGFFKVLLARMREGGIFSMTVILICFLLMIFLIFRASIKLKANNLKLVKPISLINQIALIALSIGLFAQLVGLIQVLDTVESIDAISAEHFGGGIKMTVLPPLFGGTVFIIGRISTFILSWLRKENEEIEAVNS